MDAKQQACAHSSLSLACYFPPFIKALYAQGDVVEVIKLVEELNSLTPGFSQVWATWLDEDEEFGDGEPPTEYSVFLEYNDFVISQLDKLADNKIARLFTYIENSLNSNDSDLAEAVATCFLESLIQKSYQFDTKKCFPFLGEASKAYCKSWDNFNLKKTKGLW